MLCDTTLAVLLSLNHGPRMPRIGAVLRRIERDTAVRPPRVAESLELCFGLLAFHTSAQTCSPKLCRAVGATLELSLLVERTVRACQLRLVEIYT